MVRSFTVAVIDRVDPEGAGEVIGKAGVGRACLNQLQGDCLAAYNSPASRDPATFIEPPSVLWVRVVGA